MRDLTETARQTSTFPATSPVPAAIANPAKGVVTVWSDIGCPWATLALHTLRTASTGREILIDHRAFPLERFNRRATPKPIIDAEVVAIAGVRPELGWAPWSGPEWTYPVTTVPAMLAVQAAKDPRVGGLAASDQLDAALRAAWYAAGRCISIETEILDIAGECDLVNESALTEVLAAGGGRGELEAQWESAQSDWVKGSPHLYAGPLALHNPGADYHWTAPAGKGFPRLTSYSTDWTEDVLAAAGDVPRPANPDPDR